MPSHPALGEWDILARAGVVAVLFAPLVGAVAAELVSVCLGAIREAS